MIQALITALGRLFTQALYGAPLCPAGHLPHKGGDQQLCSPRLSCNVGDWRNKSGRLISPLVGEMSGRTEGGNVGRRTLFAT